MFYSRYLNLAMIIIFEGFFTLWVSVTLNRGIDNQDAMLLFSEAFLVLIWQHNMYVEIGLTWHRLQFFKVVILEANFHFS